MDNLERQIVAEIVTMRLRGDSLYYEMTCPIVFHPNGDENGIPCGQRFKFIKGTGGTVICPKCGCQMDSSQPGIREAVMAIPVDD